MSLAGKLVADPNGKDGFLWNHKAPQVDALRIPPWVIGLATGVFLSAADAVITKAYAPILVLGAIGGAVIGWVVGRFGR
jgi:hypothetical protein